MNDNLETAILRKYLSAIIRDKFHRYRSWDNCFKLFSENKLTENHSLQLAFYLASWGMYRGSSGLLQKNHLIHDAAVEIIYKNKYRDLKCNDTREISKKQIPLIIELKEELANHYKKIRFERGFTNNNISDTDTLLSKILLGTMACVPAYDRYFIVGLKEKGINLSKFNKSSLTELLDFIDFNKNTIEKFQREILESIDFHYPVMKILDMYFWQVGYGIEMTKKKRRIDFGQT
jgi:hypothetical protein